MDTRATYRRIVQDVLTAYHEETRHAVTGVERQLVLDTERDHYLLLTVGWDGYQRLDSIVIHMDIKDDQVWIQYDGTERGMANDLLACGIPKADIVLGFHAPYKRPHTGFGVR